MRPSPELVPAKVVLVEDDLSVQCILREALEAAGFAVQAFESPFPALAEIRRDLPDVVVLDWHLPDANGYVVLERVRHTCDQKPRVLVLTGDVRLKVSSELAEVMRKPVSINRFIERVIELGDLPSRSSRNGTE